MLAKLYKKKAHLVDMETDCKCKHNDQVSPSCLRPKKESVRCQRDFHLSQSLP